MSKPATKLIPHALADLFPMMDSDSFAALKADIEANGQREKIWLYDGMIIDGRNRYLACTELGIEPSTRVWSGKDSLVAFVVSLNLNRRHLTPSQRAVIAQEVLPALEAEAKERMKRKPKSGPSIVTEQNGSDSRDEAAKIFSVSNSYISSAKKLKAESPKLAAQVKLGELTLPKALAAVKKTKQKAKQEAVENTSDPVSGIVTDLAQLNGKKFGTIYADPPWQYGNQSTRASTDNHYGTMTVDELCKMPVGEHAADDSHLHLWTTNAFLFDAKQIIEAWGFEYRSCFVWVKTQMGIGNYWRVSHEFLLLGIRGDAKHFNEHKHKSWGEFKRTKHSSKPEQIRHLIEKVSPGPFLELFGRKQVEGWDVHGDDVKRRLIPA